MAQADRLLEGEDPTTSFTHDARHWIAVYRQMLAEAWHDSRLPEETVRTYIVRLRRKLAELGAPAEIANRPRYGYSLVFDRRQANGNYDSVT